MVENNFPAIALDGKQPFDRIRELYLFEEPALLASIRRADRREATRIINTILVHIYSVGEERSDLLKGLLLELVVMMSRAAVEAGAGQTEVLGMRFQHLCKLAVIEDDEQMAAWLRESVLRIFEAVERKQGLVPHQCVSKALQIIREEAGSDLSREGVARRAGSSPTRGPTSSTRLSARRSTTMSKMGMARPATAGRTTGRWAKA